MLLITEVNDILNSSDDQEYLLKLLKGVKKLPKSQLPEEAVGGVGTPAGAATPSATAPTASFMPGRSRPRTPSPGSKEGKRSDRDWETVI